MTFLGVKWEIEPEPGGKIEEQGKTFTETRVLGENQFQ